MMRRAHDNPDDAAEIPSPCQGTCTYDIAAGLCRDCGRLAVEIAEWGLADTVRRREICAAAACRIAARQQAAHPVKPAS